MTYIRFFLSVLIVIFSHICAAQIIELGSTGLAEKNSFSYFTAYRAIIDADKVKSLQLIENLNSGKELTSSDESYRQLILEFKSRCGDNDSFDRVYWQNTGTSQDVYAFNFSCMIKGEDNNGKLYSFVIDTSSNKMLEVVSRNITLEPLKSDPSQLRIVIVETIGMMAGVAGTFVAISKAFPNEQDKILHGVGSAIFASALTSFVSHQLGFSKNKSAIVGFAITTLLGALVEVVEPHVRFQGNHGDYDPRDLKADAIGAAIGSLTMRLSFEFY